MPTDNEEFARKARARFEHSVTELDAATLSQLNQRRQRALAMTAKGSHGTRWAAWMPATGVAAVALIALMMFQDPAITELPPLEPAAQDIDVLIGDDTLEILEDLDFYSSMDAMVAGNAG